MGGVGRPPAAPALAGGGAGAALFTVHEHVAGGADAGCFVAVFGAVSGKLKTLAGVGIACMRVGPCAGGFLRYRSEACAHTSSGQGQGVVRGVANVGSEYCCETTYGRATIR